jgi:hypothetical protein
MFISDKKDGLFFVEYRQWHRMNSDSYVLRPALMHFENPALTAISHTLRTHVLLRRGPTLPPIYHTARALRHSQPR